MADTRNEIDEHDEIQELSKREMEDVTGGGTKYEYDALLRLRTITKPNWLIGDTR